ncbi:disease resistance protein RPV1 isoform X2 [Rosa chinensis]|uniref:disease resistance protein RPV1 isoform X2 n=1 Tax=Rosa chinensis TaxID=74649 RepID=UPI001AD9371C|nr:disease resistance protein RPV1 isoform X2 [Rosa chinensis]
MATGAIQKVPCYSYSPSSSSSSRRWTYDVFLSFRGEDTRKGFTGHLHMALKEAGINAFIDDQLRRGEDITAELVQAIEGSRISVIVFSRRYADSGWCLEELVKIMECRTTLGQMVLPIFYDVDPSVVRRQTGIFADAFKKHEERFREDKVKVQRWRDALTEAANLSGHHLADGHEAKFIKEIINAEINKQLTNTQLFIADYQVGLNSRAEKIINHLNIGKNDADVRMVGILGMSGVGKTTVAKVIYNELYHTFRGQISFLEKVRETQHLVDLQRQLLVDILNGTKITISNVSAGIIEIKRRLGSKRVLVIIDDVDHSDQLKALAIKRDSFGAGSRIIITTKDEHFLRQLHVDSIYHAEQMNKEEALELLSWHAFGNCGPDREYLELARKVVDYCGGLPLAIQVLGSFLCTRSTGEWESTVEKLKRIPPREIQEKLKISYDGLGDDTEKDIFLDISCFFIGMDKNYVTHVLDGCGFSSEIGIRVLHERCLITSHQGQKLMMHDLVRDMGREIVRAKSPNNLGKRSRLWHPDDVKSVLTNNTGTKRIEGIILDLADSEDSGFTTEAFKEMQNLRLLQLNYANLTGGYEFFCKEIRWLCWHGFPLSVIPKEFYQPNLVAIDLRFSKLTHVWEDTGVLENLKILNLGHSHYLLESPDFSKLPNLEKLILKDCKSLSKVHKSIGHLKRLVLVNLKDCKVLKALPGSFYKLKTIKTLVLSGCSRFEKFGKNLGNMESLTTLQADKTALTKVPSVGNLYCLRELSLVGCNLHEVPKDLGSLSFLEDLDLGGLHSLNLDNNNFGSLPSLSGLLQLTCLRMAGCTKLEEINGLPTSLHILNADECTALRRMPNFSEMKMQRLKLNNSPQLIEFPGLEKSLNVAMRLTMMAHNNFTNYLLKDSTLEGWIGAGDILVGGNEIPKWFEYITEDGGQVHFRVPQEIGCDLKVLAVCVVYSANSADSSQGLYDFFFYVVNHTKRTSFKAETDIAFARNSHEYYLWLGHLSNDEFKLGGGDLVDLVAVIPYEEFRVEKIGLRLLSDRCISSYPKPMWYDVIPYYQGLLNITIYECDDEEEEEEGPSHVPSKEHQPFNRRESDDNASMETSTDEESLADQDTPVLGNTWIAIFSKLCCCLPSINSS